MTKKINKRQTMMYRALCKKLKVVSNKLIDVPSHESEWSCICVLDVLILPLSFYNFSIGIWNCFYSMVFFVCFSITTSLKNLNKLHITFTQLTQTRPYRRELTMDRRWFYSLLIVYICLQYFCLFLCVYCCLFPICTVHNISVLYIYIYIY
jgi:hypothetical protein